MLDQIEKYLPDVKKFVSKNILENKTAMKNALSKGYNILPFVVRVIVKEETFVNFCLENKHAIFGGKPFKKIKKTEVKLKKKVLGSKK